MFSYTSKLDANFVLFLIILIRGVEFFRNVLISLQQHTNLVRKALIKQWFARLPASTFRESVV